MAATYKLVLFAANEDGTRIYALLKHKKKNLVKGFYDFNIDKFIVMKYFKDNFPQGQTKDKIKEKLRKLLMIERNWEM